MAKEVAPERVQEPAGASHRDQKEDEEVRCLACDHGVTRRSLRTERHGKHQHAFLNPAGVPYTIALYSDAPGTVGHGDMESHFTWFPGHAWRIVLCARCQTHLGWSFHGEAAFFGLIVERMR